MIFNRRKKQEGKESRRLNEQLDISLTLVFIFTWFSLKIKTFQAHFSKKQTAFLFFFFYMWVFFHEHSRITGLQGKGIPLTPHYHFHRLHRHLDISQAITAESSPLHIAGSRDSNREPLVSGHKSLTTKPRALLVETCPFLVHLINVKNVFNLCSVPKQFFVK